MGISFCEEKKKFSLYKNKYSASPPSLKLWKALEGKKCESNALSPVLLNDLENTFSGLMQGNSLPYEEQLQKIKEALLEARKNAVLARSQSMPMAQRQGLCREAMERYELAQDLLFKLKLHISRFSTEERRRVRAVEGAPEWRAIRHAIRKSSELVSPSPH